jgi:hypothetical protein
VPVPTTGGFLATMITMEMIETRAANSGGGVGQSQ